MSSNHSTHNRSSPVDTQPESQFQQIFTIASYVVALLGNGFLLLVFAKDRQLLTPFNVFIINLLVGNVLLVVIEFPLMVLTLYSGQFENWLATDLACTVWLYGYMVVLAGIVGSHTLIALSRVWAVLFPINYRTRHTIPVALLMCLASWLYIHILGGSGLLVDTLLYRRLIRPYRCQVNFGKQAAYFKAAKLVLFSLPELVMFVSFLIIGCNHLARWLKRRRQRSDRRILPQRLTTARRGAGVSHNRSKGLLVLALLTVSVAICWTPNILFFTIKTFVPLPASEAFRVTQHVLVSCQMVLDPLLFVLGLRSLRNGVKKFLLLRHARIATVS
ncbi:hypothetical protein BV898_02794 [Hypsibius exemplaris]|uniref:G-protein coupled receptors family 1 profile domain-containing protein n=1 Tax=Hypsibius exemplaris TaxID=2072580 RepID=A0A1W0X740_HYPEX|nr:hypothetical protein BV898_02794 [Hypsibius exemplaris]